MRKKNTKINGDPAAAEPSAVRRFSVYGYAFVPVEVRIKVEAENADKAMAQANKILKTKIRDHIVPGSYDDGAAFKFDALGADEVA